MVYRTKERLLELTKKYDVDEVWINFKDPFTTEDYPNDSRFFIFCDNPSDDFKVGLCSDEFWDYFDERLSSGDWRDTVQSNIFGVMVIKRKPGIMKLFNQEKNLSLLYRKGEGIIGY